MYKTLELLARIINHNFLRLNLSTHLTRISEETKTQVYKTKNLSRRLVFTIFSLALNSTYILLEIKLRHCIRIVSNKLFIDHRYRTNKNGLDISSII